MKILITGGGTREPIDGVRFITNFSTGRTASELSDFFCGLGHDVSLLIAESAVRPKDSRCRIDEYATFIDLDSKLRSRLGSERFDLVVHLAAVSDYSVESIEIDGNRIQAGTSRKLPSGSPLTLRLKPNFKILDRLRSYAAQSSPRIVAFKLTRGASPDERLQAVKKISDTRTADWVVHNDLADREKDQGLFTVFRGEKRLGTASRPDELGRVLISLLDGSSR